MAKSRNNRKKKKHPKKPTTNKRVKNYLHSGSLGDIIYSLPFILSKGGGNLYIKDTHSHAVMKGQFLLMKSLLEQQTYIFKVEEYPSGYGNKHEDIMGGKIESIDRLMEMRNQPINYHPDIKIDYDLDLFRLSPYVFKEHLITSYFTYFERNPSLKLPFLNLYNYKSFIEHKGIKGEYILISRTSRYTTPYDWNEVLEKTKDKKRFFVGLEEDYITFCSTYNCDMKFLPTTDICELAYLIKGCKRIYCNTSVSLAVAIGLKKPYSLEVHHNHVVTGLPLETILNTEVGLIDMDSASPVKDLKILICVPAYNRKKVTELSLKSIYENKKNATVWVYNDWSTEYDNDFLEPFADKVIKLEKSNKKVVKNEKNIEGMGVQHLRWYQFREFIKMDEYDAIYFTDSDAIHDPDYTDVLKNLYSQIKDKKGQRLPISLYNSVFHTLSTLEDRGGIMVRKTGAGISQMYDKEMCRKIVEKLDLLEEDPDYEWDYRCLEFLDRPIITTKNSYVEHYGATEGSMHTTEGDWDRDRAVNPTQHLAKERDKIINYLEHATFEIRR